MASLRKASAYSKKHARPNTRTSKKRSKAFIKTIPPIKVVKFNMGKKKKYDDNEFDVILRLISEEKVQIRDNAIEAARQSITRKLEKELPGNFYFEIRVYPHHILRENKMLTGAGADRMQSGMKHSFGKAGGRAAMIDPGKDIFLIATSGEKGIKIVRTALKAIRAKLPCKTKIQIEILSKKEIN
jgi:large subunit ribosomal protein L10e